MNRRDVAVALVLALAPAARAGNFAGTFKNDRMTVELRAEGARFKGTIQFQGKSYPCEARETDGKLRGAFTTPGAAFPFEATLAGDTLTLQSGRNTYTLRRHTPVVPPVPPNPLEILVPPPPQSKGRSIIIDMTQLKADFRRALAAHDRKDYATALRLVRPAAEKGHVGSRYLLALMYEHGRGVPADRAQAARWYQKAGDYTPALVNLGMLYRNGRGVAQDLAKARALFEQAAYLGSATAQRALGAVHFNGMGVPRNPIEGVAWMQLAAKGGDKMAQQNLAVVRNRNILTPEQWQAAQQRAAALQAKIQQRNTGGKATAAAAAKPDFSSPRAAVQTFIAACTAGNRAVLRQCISAHATGEFAKLRDGTILDKPAAQLREMFRGATITGVEQPGKVGAIVGVKLPNSPRGTERIEMHKEAGGWKILDF